MISLTNLATRKNRPLRHDLATTVTRPPIEELSIRRYIGIVWAPRPASPSVTRAYK